MDNLNVEAPDQATNKAKEDKLRQEYEQSIEHTYKVPQHGIEPIHRECAYPVRLGEEKDLTCTEDTEGTAIKKRN